MQETLGGCLNDVVTLHYWPDPCLTTACAPIADEDFGDDLADVGNQMLALTNRLDGLGLAAPQVGILKRFFVMKFPNDTHDPMDPEILCNPVITDIGEETDFQEEGCLSLPYVFQQVCRPTEVSITYWTPFGEPREMGLLGLEARIALHEIDHLNGINFFHPSRMPRNLRKQVEAQWKKDGLLNISRSKIRAAGPFAEAA
jgi:peptide deformylase